MTITGPFENNNSKRYLGLSTDTKPATGVNAGDKFFETDTQSTYFYSGSAWVLGG